jgi:hypothetical protein
VLAQQEVGVLQVLRPADLRRQQEVRRHRPPGALVGQRQDAAVHDRQLRQGRHHPLRLVGRDHADPGLLARGVILLARQ